VDHTVCSIKIPAEHVGLISFQLTYAIFAQNMFHEYVVTVAR